MNFPAYRSRYLPALTETELGRARSQSDALVILPVGAVEQHGPHLPVGADSLIAEILLGGICAALDTEDPVYVAPPITVSKSNEHTGFPGTLMISRESLVRVVTAILDQLEAWGFRRTAILNTHGGNLAVLRSLVRERQAHGNGEIQLLDPMPETDMSEREQTYGIHAGEYESSLLYAHVPELCLPDQADCQWIDERATGGADLRPEFAPATFAWASADLSATGTMGDATQASAEKGKAWTRRAVQSLVTQIRNLLT